MTKRIGIDEYFVEMAKLVARRATCARRKVGCVLVNEHDHVMATGYNGVASGLPHCLDTPCPGAGQPSGQGLHLCQAIHAEQNALMQCRNINEIATCYTVSSPCIHCLRLLLNTTCRRIVFAEEYPHPEAAQLWLNDGRDWIHHKS